MALVLASSPAMITIRPHTHIAAAVLLRKLENAGTSTHGSDRAGHKILLVPSTILCPIIPTLVYYSP